MKCIEIYSRSNLQFLPEACNLKNQPLYLLGKFCSSDVYCSLQIQWLEILDNQVLLSQQMNSCCDEYFFLKHKLNLTEVIDLFFKSSAVSTIWVGFCLFLKLSFFVLYVLCTYLIPFDHATACFFMLVTKFLYIFCLKL